jgi:sensor domain CHASE-containing protein
MLPSGFILDEDKKARYEQNIIDCQKQLIAEDQRIKANIQRDYEAAQAQLDTELNGKIDRRINKVISAEDKAEFEEFLKFQALKKQQKKKA